MSALSWRWPFRKRGSASSEEKKGSSDEERIMEEFGVTEQLCEVVRGFNVSTFKDFPLQDRSEEPISATVTSDVRKDLTGWQERHASLVLSKVKDTCFVLPGNLTTSIYLVSSPFKGATILENIFSTS